MPLPAAPASDASVTGLGQDAPFAHAAEDDIWSFINYVHAQSLSQDFQNYAKDCALSGHPYKL